MAISTHKEMVLVYEIFKTVIKPRIYSTYVENSFTLANNKGESDNLKTTFVALSMSLVKKLTLILISTRRIQ